MTSGLTAAGVLVLVGLLFVAVDVLREERCPPSPRRRRRVARYARVMTDERKTQPKDPDVISEDDVLREGVVLDEGAVNQTEEARLQEAARDRRRPGE